MTDVIRNATLISAFFLLTGANAHALADQDGPAPSREPAHLKSPDCPQPEYPSLALRAKPPLEGTVKMRLLVGADGIVRRVEYVKSSGHRDLDTAARFAFSRCPFEPALADGVPQESWAEVSYTFAPSAEQIAHAGDMPPVVARLAQAYAALPQAAQEQPDRDQLVRDYARSFFDGFTHPDGDISTSSALMREAYTQGRSYRRSHPDSEAGILGGYGYDWIQVDGTWTRGVEQSDFVPKDRGNEHWWVSSMPRILFREAPTVLPDPKAGPVRVHFSGYLSQPGKHGHLGMSNRQLLYTDVRVIDAPVP